jgi:CBS domain-containing protein
MKARDIMTTGVVTVEAQAPVIRAAQLMLQNRVSGLPVVDASGTLVGMITEGDFLRRGELGTQRRRPRWLEFLIGPGRLADEYVRACGRKVDEIMTPNPYTVSEDASLEEVVASMEKHRIKRLPVVAAGKVVGIVSRANLMQAVSTLSREVEPAMAADGAIREAVLAEVGKQFWGPQLNVIVRNGVVEIWGAIADDRERKAVMVAAENVPGVKQVHDHLVWIEPISGMILQSEEDEALARVQAS